MKLLMSNVSDKDVSGTQKKLLQNERRKKQLVAPLSDQKWRVKKFWFFCARVCRVVAGKCVSVEM